MGNLSIIDSGLFQKMEETHYEKFTRIYKRVVGKSPIQIVQDVFESYSGGNSERVNVLDDTPYQHAALFILNAQLIHFGYKGKMWTLESIYGGEQRALSEFRSVMNVLQHTYKFSRNRMIFRFEEALTAKLLHTDLSKVDSSFLTSPYESIYLDVPHNEELYIPNNETGLHKVKGFYVLYGHDIDVKGVRLPDGVGLDDDGVHPYLKYNGVPANKVVRILAVAGTNENSTNEMDDATFYMTFFLAPGDVLPQIKLACEKANKEGPDYQHYMLKIFSFVLNALLYITNPQADLVRTHAKFKKAPKGTSPDTLSHIDVVSVGNSVRITHDFRKSYREGTLGKLLISTPLWMVRGHWRNQAHGPERSLRRMQWIEPYSKGSGIVDEMSGRRYDVS